jgi:hypothetical protein
MLGLPPYRFLSPKEVAAVLNRSLLGGIFSELEGPCYASTEYFLCGLPVVSTPSSGGRHVWYTPHNSVLVEPSPAAVAEGVRLGLKKLASGEFDRQRIRHEAVQQCEAFRGALVSKVRQLCEQWHSGRCCHVGGAGCPDADSAAQTAVVQELDALEQDLKMRLSSMHKLGLK